MSIINFQIAFPENMTAEEVLAHQQLFQKLARAIPTTKPGNYLVARAEPPDYNWKLSLKQESWEQLDV